MKACKACKTEESTKWRKGYCNSCYLKGWRVDNISSVKDYSRTTEVRFKHAKKVAKQRKLEWPLSLEEFSSFCNKPCFYCDNKLGEVVSTGSGLDRLDNSQGYIASNIVSCCRVCNTIRSEFLSVYEMREVVQLICKLRNIG